MLMALTRSLILSLASSRIPGVSKEDRLACTYTTQKSAWMNALITKRWFKEQFVPQVLKRLKFLKLLLHALLLLGNAPSHPAPEHLTYNTKDGQITVLYLPPNTTSILQPMGQGPIEAIKRPYRKELITALSTEGYEDTSLIDLIKRMDIMDVIKMSAKVWSEARVEAIKNSWNKTCIWSRTGEQEQTKDDNEEDEDSVACRLQGHHCPATWPLAQQH